MRGPLVTRSPLTGGFVPLRAKSRRSDFFVLCVRRSIARIHDRRPEALEGIDIGVESVPQSSDALGSHIPLAAAIEAQDGRHGRVVLFRRPLERRSPTRADLARLVHRTLVEQLAAITSWTIDDIDPTVFDDGL